MSPPATAYVRALRLAAKQHGALSRKQAIDRGMTDHMLRSALRSGRLQAPLRGVYVAPGAPATRAQRVAVVVLASGPAAAASHWTAAGLHGLERCALLPVHVTVSHGGARRLPAIVHESRALTAADRCVIGGIAATTAERTIADVATYLARDPLELLMEDAYRKRRTTPGRLAAYLDERCGRGVKGSTLLLQIVGARDPARSAGDAGSETVFMQMVRDHGLPVPDAQFPLPSGRAVDFAYVRFRIAIEMDSVTWHGSPQRVMRDARKQTELALLGWVVLRFTWEDLRDRPAAVAASIRRALRQAGWVADRH